MTRVPVLRFVQQNFSTVGIFILAGAANLKDRNFKTQEKDSHRIINCFVGELQLLPGMRQKIFKELGYQDMQLGWSDFIKKK